MEYFGDVRKNCGKLSWYGSKVIPPKFFQRNFSVLNVIAIL